MDDLISRSKLIEFANNHFGGVIDCNDIARFPTIDAEPVRHGRWEFYEDWGAGLSRVDMPEPFDAGWKCSCCGTDLADYLTKCLGMYVYADDEDKKPKVDRCPHCGAKMDAKEDAE